MAYVKIEAMDSEDARMLAIRIRKYLRTLEHGDWSGRVVEVVKSRRDQY